MNWDWDKLQQQKQGRGGSGGSGGPNFDNLTKNVRQIRQFKLPAGRWIIALLVVLWLLSGIYIVDPPEVGVVLRFGAFSRMTQPGPHYHLPFPIESALTPNITKVRYLEVGYRSIGGNSAYGQQNQYRLVPEESLMLTGDENIVDVQFIVQYQIKDAINYLFNVKDQPETVKNAAEAAMREVIGYNKIDSALTIGKEEIQIDCKELLQAILDSYETGLQVTEVKLQDVHPPREVIDSFKDVASAREDKIRFINEAEAYRNDLLPRARGQAAKMINQAKAYQESVTRKAHGETDRFISVLEEYLKAPEVTRERLYIETMETVFSSPEMEKVLLSHDVLETAVPYLPLDKLPGKPASQLKGGN